MEYSKRIVTHELVRLQHRYRGRLRRWGIAPGTNTIPVTENLSKDELRAVVFFLDKLIGTVIGSDDKDCDGLRSTKIKPLELKPEVTLSTSTGKKRPKGFQRGNKHRQPFID